MVFIWGFHFIVVKDAFTDLHPLTFNALRFLVGLPLMLLIGVQHGEMFALPRRDLGLIVLTTVIGPFSYQMLFISGLDRTTATNTALLVATMPVWTAIFSMVGGLTEVRRQLLAGIGLALGGVVLVVVAQGEGEIALTRNDLIGSVLVTGAAMSSGISQVISKPLVDRVGGMRLAVWRYSLNVFGLTLVALPGLVTLSPGDVPLGSLPHILYSGVLSGVGGFVFVTYGLREIGPTRTSSYFNFNPIIAAVAGIALLGEPLTLGLMAGGPLALYGVMVVRRNTFLRPPGDVLREDEAKSSDAARRPSVAP